MGWRVRRLRSCSGHLRYRLVDDAGGRFEIDPVSGLVSVADESLLDNVHGRSHRITVETLGPDGSISTRTFEITLLEDARQFSISDVPDEAKGECAPKHAATGTVVGAVAVDAGADESVRFRLIDDAGGRFAVDASTGVVTVADGTLLDYEAAASHSITVAVASSAGWISTQQFTIGRGDGKGAFVVSADSEYDTTDICGAQLRLPVSGYRGRPVGTPRQSADGIAA